MATIKALFKEYANSGVVVSQDLSGYFYNYTIYLFLYNFYCYFQNTKWIRKDFSMQVK